MQPSRLAFFFFLGLAGCVNRGVDDIDAVDAAQTHRVEFGVVLKEHRVNIRSDDIDALFEGGALGAGAAGGYFGTPVGAASGFGIGLLLGYEAHVLGETWNGVEYVVRFDRGIRLVPQLQSWNDPVFRPGDLVMMQVGGTWNRLLSADNIPIAYRPIIARAFVAVPAPAEPPPDVAPTVPPPQHAIEATQAPASPPIPAHNPGLAKKPPKPLKAGCPCASEKP